MASKRMTMKRRKVVKKGKSSKRRSVGKRQNRNKITRKKHYRCRGGDKDKDEYEENEIEMQRKYTEAMPAMQKEKEHKIEKDNIKNTLAEDYYTNKLTTHTNDLTTSVKPANVPVNNNNKKKEFKSYNLSDIAEAEGWR